MIVRQSLAPALVLHRLTLLLLPLLYNSCAWSIQVAFPHPLRVPVWFHQILSSSIGSKRPSAIFRTIHSFDCLRIQVSKGSSLILRDRQSNADSGEQIGDEEDDDDEEEDDDDDPPEVNVKDFRVPSSPSTSSSSTSTMMLTSFGFNKGRSSPSTRKAMGTSGSSTTRIHICTHCGSEFVKYFGRCPTCREWNTLVEREVTRQPPSQHLPSSSKRLKSSSWLEFGNDDTPWGGGRGGRGESSIGRNILGATPICLTDLYSDHIDDDDDVHGKARRIRVPGDSEINNVLGGGLVPGSLILVGGDPGVGKSTLLLQTAAAVASLSTPPLKIGMGLATPISPTATMVKGNKSGNVLNQNATEVKIRSPSPAREIGPVWYVSGEETPHQIALRGRRLGIRSEQLFLLSETNIDLICDQVIHLFQSATDGDSSAGTSSFTDEEDSYKEEYQKSLAMMFRPRPPSLLIIDSIQTMVCHAGGSSSAGGMTQVRECVALCLRLAKSTDIPILLVGHVTKSGDVAGPRTVEHMVDAVLYLEGPTSSTNEATLGGGSGGGSSDAQSVRVLRASKNRFGSSEEVGLYEMTKGRLLPVTDPSSLFLAGSIQEQDVEGSAICIRREGMRAVAIEVQVLVTPTDNKSGYGRRTVDGMSYARLSLLLGVMQKQCTIFLSRRDIYVNVVGQLRLDRRGSGGHDSNSGDLCVLVAIASSWASIPVRSDTAFVGEVGLLGELRPVSSSLDKRIAEARRMGFSRVITPRQVGERKAPWSSQKKKRKKEYVRSTFVDNIEWIQCDHVKDAINAGLISPIPKRRQPMSSTPSIRDSFAPGRFEDLELRETIIDDDDVGDLKGFD